LSAPAPDARAWQRWILGTGGLAVFAALLLRDHGLYASVFGDEWSYSAYSRLGPVWDAKLPSYLYLWIFRATNLCGSGFLDCARILNAALLVAALPLIYRVLRAYTRPALAAALAVVCVAAPVNSYTAYFMPESLYYLMFWGLALAVLRPYAPRPWRYGAVAGAILGAMCLVKLHALFMAIGFAAFVVADALWPQPRRRLRPALAVLAAAAAAFVAVRFGLGYALGGPGSLSLLGEFYQVQANNNASLDRAAMAANLLRSGWGHVLALSLLFGPLLVPALLQFFGAAGHGDRDDGRARSAAVFALATLGTLVAITVYFTASMGSNENVGRLHLRYYDFCLPLLLLPALSWRGLGPARWQRRLAWAAAIALAALTLYAGARGLRGYSPFPVDAPELTWILGRNRLTALVALLGATLCLAWAWRGDAVRAGVGPLAGRDFRLPRLAALGHYAVVAALGAGAVAASMRGQAHADAYVRGGQTLRERHPELVADSQLLGRDIFGLVKARFYVDSTAIEPVLLEPGREPADALDWSRASAVLFNGLTLPAGSYSRRQDYPGFSIYWLEQGDAVDLRHAQPAMVRSLHGLSAQEPFGRWTDGAEAVIEFDREFSGTLRLVIDTASVFGPNVGQPVTIRMGGAQASASFDGESSRRAVLLREVAPTRELRLLIPHPTSPRELGNPQGDPRRLGLALTQLHLRRVDAAPAAPADCPHCSLAPQPAPKPAPAEAPRPR